MLIREFSRSGQNGRFYVGFDIYNSMKFEENEFNHVGLVENAFDGLMFT